MTEKILRMDDVFLTPEDSAATYARWYGAITGAQDKNLKEYFRLMGLDNIETIAEFGPKSIKANSV